MTRISAADGQAGLFDRLHSGSPSKEDLRKAAQLAVEVEFTTIPAYLTALYSMSQTDNFAYQALRSVAMEEMFHVNQAANILVALGGKPRFTGKHAPKYPCYLPHANPETTPLVGLCRASPQVFGSMFAAIETPAEAGAPPQGDNYDTIGQLYDALTTAVAAYPGNPFEADPATGRQRTDIYLGKFGGNVVKVTDKDTALQAVNEIVKQGEGTVPATAPLIPLEQFGTYNQYGQRTDGTYGPIMGTPYEMSHFIKFRKVSLDTAAFPATLPIVSNGRIEEYTNPEAAAKAVLFDKHYSVMLHALELCFEPPSRHNPVDPYFGVVLNLMHKVLPNLARALVTTPANRGGNSSSGPNAAPTWTYQPKTGVKELEVAIVEVMDTVRKGATDLAARDAALAPLAAAFEGLKLITANADELDL
jgi:hypothetical protein